MPALSTGKPLFALGLPLLFVLVTTSITWAEHETYNSTSLDMAVYAQLLWNTANGLPFETSLLLRNRIHLGEHVALLLLPLAPLYGLAPEVKLLLLLQQAALAASGLPVYWLAQRKLGPRMAALALGAYYAMPTLAEVALDAFYPVAFATLPVGWAAAFAVVGWPLAATLPALFAMLVEEEAALLTAGVGFYLLVGAPSKRAGALLVLTGGLWLLLAVVNVMPAFSQATAAEQDRRTEGHFTQLRAGPLRWLATVLLERLEPDLVGAIVRAPSAEANACQQPGQCSALRWWIYPTAGLPLLSPTTISMVVPPAATLLLADRPGRFRRHWAAPMLPVIWLGTVLGLARLGGRPAALMVGAAAMVLASLVMYRLDSSLPLGGQYEGADLVLSPRGADLKRMAGCIPDSAGVLATRRGLAHLANRPAVYVFPATDYAPGLWQPRPDPPYILVDLQNRDAARELEGPSSPLRTNPAYRELARTPNALLLEASGWSGPSSTVC